MPSYVPLLDDALPTATLHVSAWADPVLDRVGHDPRSAYVEQFWLGILGPSTTWLLRRLADGLDARPDGYDLTLEDTARSLGLGMKGGRHSPFVRALVRACQFRLAQIVGDEGLAVRTKLPSLSRHQLERLPPGLRDAHRAWEERARQTTRCRAAPPPSPRARPLAARPRRGHRRRRAPAPPLAHPPRHGPRSAPLGHHPPGRPRHRLPCSARRRRPKRPPEPLGADDRWEPLGASQALPPVPIPGPHPQVHDRVRTTRLTRPEPARSHPGSAPPVRRPVPPSGPADHGRRVPRRPAAGRRCCTPDCRILDQGLIVPAPHHAGSFVSLSLHWFLPTAGDSRDVVGFGPSSPSTGRPRLPVPGRPRRRAGGLRRRADADGHVLRGRLAHHGRPDPRTKRLRFLVAFRPGLHLPARRPAGRDVPAAQRWPAPADVVTGGSGEEQRRFGDHLDHDLRYERCDEFLTV